MSHAQNLMPQFERFVDLITLTDGRGRAHSYARTARGYHVPIECMTHEDIRDALEASRHGSHGK